MAGVKGRSGGGGKKSLAQHIKDGTYRKDRHGAIPPDAIAVAETADHQLAPVNLVLLPLDDIEQKALDEIMAVLGGQIPPHMSFALSTMAHNLVIYCKLHADILKHGMFDTDKDGNTTMSAAFKMRDLALKQLRLDYAAFAMSYGERAALAESALRISERMMRPQPGKALEK